MLPDNSPDEERDHAAVGAGFVVRPGFDVALSHGEREDILCFLAGRMGTMVLTSEKVFVHFGRSDQSSSNRFCSPTGMEQPQWRWWK